MLSRHRVHGWGTRDLPGAYLDNPEHPSWADVIYQGGDIKPADGPEHGSAIVSAPAEL